MKIDTFDFKKKYYIVAVLLFVIGYVIAIMDSPFNWLSMFVFGMISLWMLYGRTNLLNLFLPIKRQRLWFILKYLAILIALEVAAVLFVLYFYPSVFHSLERINLAAIPSKDHYFFLERVLRTLEQLISLVGEEVAMASILLPLINLFSKGTLSRFAWPIINVLGCIIFMLLHLPRYHFNWGVVFIIGVTRYPITASWKATNSLRGGIYVHWLSDIPLIVGLLFG